MLLCAIIFRPGPAFFKAHKLKNTRGFIKVPDFEQKFP